MCRDWVFLFAPSWTVVEGGCDEEKGQGGFQLVHTEKFNKVPK